MYKKCERALSDFFVALVILQGHSHKNSGSTPDFVRSTRAGASWGLASNFKIDNRCQIWSIGGANGGAERGAKKPDFSGFFSIDKLVSVCELSDC